MKKTIKYNTLFIVIILTLAPVIAAHMQEVVNKASNPVIWADVPDPSVVRVGENYYMSSTTMHMNPGVPIMKSTDLVNWTVVSYCYDILDNTDGLALRNGQSQYGNGSWASSIKYHDSTYFVSTFSYSTGRTHIYQTQNIEAGPWTEFTINTAYHDNSLFFEEDGKVYLVYGNNDIKIIELNPTVTGTQPGGLNQVIIPNASSIAGSNFIVPAEGAHIYKMDDKYYIFLIVWPRGSMRTQLVYRSDSLTGPYEGRIALQDAGIAQGGLIDTPDGDWYAMLFQDHGAVGRIPYLIPISWENGWPILGVDGKAPITLDIPAGEGGISGIVASDEFDYGDEGNPKLNLVWQWNHNPLASYWSVTARPGFLRLTNDRQDNNFLDTRNTLTQRAFGPRSSAHVALDVSNMKDGDYAGLGALQSNYGFVGVKMQGNTKSLVMINGSSGQTIEAESIPVTQDTVYLRVDMNFLNRLDRAYFYYCYDNITWRPIGNTLQMSYTLPHFMGYRFALFNFATKSAGGYVDFDFFRVSDSFAQVYPPLPPVNINNNSASSSSESLDILYNRPGKSNPSIGIKYHLPVGTHITINIYDINGRLLDVILNETKEAGGYIYQFNANHLPGGAYLVSMETKYGKTIKKMILTN